MLNLLKEEVPHQTRRYPIYPLAEGLIAGLVVFAAVFLTTYFIFFHALEAQKGEIREGLRRSITIATTLIDPEVHKTFTEPSDKYSEAYKKAVEPFGRILNANVQIAYVYTVILRGEKIYFILDPTPEGDADGDGIEDSVGVMEEYTEPPEEMVEALQEQKAIIIKEPYTDQWGSFISGYVPFYDKDGEFLGVLGMDITVENYYERLAPIKRATVRAMVTGFFIAFLVGSTVWFMRNFAVVINRSRFAILSDLKEATKIVANLNTICSLRQTKKVSKKPKVFRSESKILILRSIED